MHNRLRLGFTRGGQQACGMAGVLLRDRHAGLVRPRGGTHAIRTTMGRRASSRWAPDRQGTPRPRFCFRFAC